MARFAVISNNAVENVVEAESLDVVRLLLPVSEILPETEETGVAYIGQRFFRDLGKFEPIRPYPSWTFDEKEFKWIAPKQPKSADEVVWDEAAGEWITLDELLARSPKPEDLGLIPSPTTEEENAQAIQHRN